MEKPQCTPPTLRQYSAADLKVLLFNLNIVLREMRGKKVSLEDSEALQEKHTKIRRRELFYGSFQRTMAVPEGVKTEQVKAKYHDGVLEITAPMEKRALAKKIEVEVEKN
ncbi:MAG: Hsp20/alpha crystallin family protein [Pseudomonadota bacterium]